MNDGLMDITRPGLEAIAYNAGYARARQIDQEILDLLFEEAAAPPLVFGDDDGDDGDWFEDEPDVCRDRIDWRTEGF